MDQLLGFILGVVGSVLTWWVFAHLLVPRVRFESRILVRPARDGSGQQRFLAKFYNEGRRDLIDVALTAIVSIQTKPGSDRNWASCRLAFHRDGSIEHAIPLVPRGKNRLVTLYPRHSAQIGFEYNFSEAVREKLAAGTLDLRDLLSDGADRNLTVRMQLFLFGYDRFSGARKLYQSKFYTIDDLA